jgi:hypothetical protein
VDADGKVLSPEEQDNIHKEAERRLRSLGYVR